MQEQCKLIPDHQAWKIRSQSMDAQEPQAPTAAMKKAEQTGAENLGQQLTNSMAGQRLMTSMQLQICSSKIMKTQWDFKMETLQSRNALPIISANLAGDTESILYSLNSAMPTPWSNIFSCGGRAWKTCLWLSRQTTIFPIFRFQMQLQENACSTLASINIPSWNPLRPKILHRQKGPAASDNVLPLRDKAWAAGWATRTLQESATVEVLVLTLGTCRPKWMAKTGQSGMQNCEKGHTLWK